MEEGFSDPSGEVTSAGHAILVHRPFEQPLFLEGFALLAKHGLVFDCASWHSETPQLTTLARQFPDQPIICDHVSTPVGWGPYSSHGASAVFEEWKANMADLSTCPNVMVKLSGLTMPSTGFRFETRAKPPTSGESPLQCHSAQVIFKTIPSPGMPVIECLWFCRGGRSQARALVSVRDRDIRRGSLYVLQQLSS